MTLKHTNAHVHAQQLLLNLQVSQSESELSTHISPSSDDGTAKIWNVLMEEDDIDLVHD